MLSGKAQLLRPGKATHRACYRCSEGASVQALIAIYERYLPYSLR